jgi:hypothetical protein
MRKNDLFTDVGLVSYLVEPKVPPRSPDLNPCDFFMGAFKTAGL